MAINFKVALQQKKEGKLGLAERLAKLKPKGPSLNPVKFKTKEEEAPPSITDFDVPIPVRVQLIAMSQRLVNLSEEKKDITTLRDLASDKIKAILEAYPVLKGVFLAGANRISYYMVKGRGTVNPDKLLARGISPRLIEECTDYTEERWQLKITAGEQKDEK